MAYSVQVGKSRISCHKTKRAAKKRAKALRAAGRKATIRKRKSCG